jgi:RNA polymerase sigma-70 factor (ECF subfamily)
MASYAGGDVDAFEELFRRFEPRAYAFFWKRTGARERAEDLYQDLFLRIHRARRSYDPTRPFAPWLFQIAHRLLADDVRRAFRSREVPLETRDVPCEARDAESELADRQELGRLLAGLRPGERDLLVAAKLGGAGYVELATRTGRSVDAVKKIASRAMARVRSSAARALPRPIGPSPG